MPLCSVDEWRARIGTSYCALGVWRPIKLRGSPGHSDASKCRRSVRYSSPSIGLSWQQFTELFSVIAILVVVYSMVAISSWTHSLLTLVRRRNFDLLTQTWKCSLLSCCNLMLNLCDRCVIDQTPTTHEPGSLSSLQVLPQVISLDEISLEQLSVVSMMVLLLAGDVELNPGPGTPVTSLKELIHLKVLNWHEVGFSLGIEEYELDVIRMDHPNDNKGCKTAMFSFWFKNGEDVTFEALVKALVVTDNKHTATELCREKGLPETLIETAESDYTPVYISEYAKYLKERYLSEPLIPDDPWPPSVGQHYVNLVLIKHVKECPTEDSKVNEDLLRGKIDQIAGEKTKITIEGIFAPPEEKGKVLKVLIDGAPGVGKTILTRKLCRDWADPDSHFLAEYQLVVLVHLRDPNVSKAANIEDLFYHDNPDIQLKVVAHIRKSEGVNVLLLFDGFDELSENERTRHSLFLNIIKGNVLRRCSVVVTSRPHASERLQRVPSLVRRVEILGFSESQIKTCMEQSLNDDAEASKLMYSLTQHRSDILSLCYIPLNCAIFLYIYKQDHELPSTLTQIYTKFTESTMTRQTDIVGTCNEGDLDNLGALAYRGLLEDRMVFQKTEIPNNFLGLMTATKSYSSTKVLTMYQFIHLTIQEFLAARWVVNKTGPEEQIEFCVKELINDRFRMTFVFLAGLLNHTTLVAAFERVCSKAWCIFAPPLTCDFVDSKEPGAVYLRGKYDRLGRRPVILKYGMLLAHMVFESQNERCCKSLAESIQDRVLVFDCYYMNAFHCFVLSAFISRSQCTWDLVEFRGHWRNKVNFSSNTKPNFERALQSTQVHKCIIEYMCSTKILGVLDTPPFFSLKYLELINVIVTVYDEDSDNCIWSDVEKLPRLEHLVLECRHTELENHFSVASLLQKNKLRTLHLVLHLSSYENESLSIKFPDNLKMLYTALCNNISVKKFVCDTNSQIHDINRLNLAHTSCQNNMTTLLQCNKTIQSLYIVHRCEDIPSIINSPGLLNALKHNSTLKRLIISDFCLYSFDDKLVEMLSYNKTLTSLIVLNQCKSTLLYSFSDVKSDKQLLLSCIRSLSFLASPRFPGPAFTAERLLWYQCFFTKLVDGLSKNRSLKKLCLNFRVYNLSDRSFETFLSDTNFKALFQSLCQHPNMETLIIDFQHGSSNILTDTSRNYDYTHDIHKVRNDELSALALLLIHNEVITKLVLNGFGFSDAQLRTIARALVLNGRRREIDFVTGHWKRDQRIWAPIQDYVKALTKLKRQEVCYEVSFVQTEVHKFKNLMLQTMFQLLSYTVLC